MSDTTYFIPTNTTILPLYFGSGLIMPGGYYKGFLNTFQNISEGAIIVSEDKWIPGSNCSLEVVFSLEEKGKIVPAEGQKGLFLFSAGLPVSRIKNIFFLDSTQMDNTIWNIENGTAYVPKRIISLENTPEIALHKGTNPGVKGALLSDDLLKKARQFDILLGGFAFMKVAAVTDTNFPHNYFSTLAYFNALIGEQVRAAEKNEKLDFDYSYTGLFTESSVWQYWKPFIYKDIKEKDLEEIAQHQNIKLERKVGQIRLDSLNVNSLFYDLVLLSTYGENKKKGLEDLFSLFEKNNLTDKKKEEIALLFGVHIGYSKLRRSYEVYGKQVAVKFPLESQLDYYTIESLYQYVFNNNNDKSREVREFDYLKPMLPEANPGHLKTNLTTYRILDTTIVTKKKEAVSKEALPTYSSLWNAIAIEVSSWQSANPFFKPDVDAVQNFLEHKFGTVLNDLIPVSKAADIKEYKPEHENPTPTQTMSQNTARAIDNNSARQTVMLDGLDNLNFVELKALAKKNKIKVSTQLHGSTIEMEELKRILRNTPTIL